MSNVKRVTPNVQAAPSIDEQKRQSEQALAEVVKSRLADAKLEPKALDDAGAHVVTGGNGSDLHVFVKKTPASERLDALEAQVRGTGNARRALGVSEQGEWDLGELGAWREFKIEGLDPKMPLSASGQPLRLELVSAAAKGQEVGAAFYASMDLALAVHEVIGKGRVQVRPIPAGERAGTSFVPVAPELRGVIQRLLGTTVDDVVPAALVGQAWSEWRKTQDAVTEGGLLSAAVTLGLLPTRRPEPSTWVKPTAPKARQPGELDEGLRDYLQGIGLTIPQQLTPEWCEASIDKLPDSVPHEHAKALRSLWGDLEAQKANVASELFGEAAVAPSKPQAVNAGDNRFQQAREVRAALLTEGLRGLNVPREVIGRTAQLMTEALQPSQKPYVILVGGPRNSQADRLMQLMTAMVAKNPVVATRAELADPTFGLLYGTVQGGVPSGADGLLSRPVQDKHRDERSGKVAYVLEDLSAAGSGAPNLDAKAVQAELLERLLLLQRDGRVTTFVREQGGDPQDTALANTVFLVRYEGDADKLKELVDRTPALSALAPRLIAGKAFDAASGVSYLEQELNFALQQRGVPRGVQVSFSEEVRAVLQAAYDGRAMGPVAAYDHFLPLLADQLEGLAGSGAAKSYEVVWNPSTHLTAGERRAMTQGQMPRGVTEIFGLTPGGKELPPLSFSSDWKDIKAAADRVPELERELNKLRALVATQQRSADTV